MPEPLLSRRSQNYNITTTGLQVQLRSEISREPLWSVPAPVRERLRTLEREFARDKERNHFLLCGLYSAVALNFLLIFGVAALARGETSYAVVIFSFAAATVFVYGSAWYSKHYWYAKHFLTLLMGLLCLYLYYTGGTANSGPLYYFVFPLVAVFLQGLRYGGISVVLLLGLTLLLETGAFGFNTAQYNTVFVIRVLAVYLIISMLAFLFEYIRVKAERELMLSTYDLHQMTFGDLVTSLANRRLMEKLLVTELNRTRRYPITSCILLIEPDVDPHFQAEQYREVRLALAEELRKHLRVQDIPGCWDEVNFLVLLPETGLEGANALAERLLAECRERIIHVAGTRPRPISISIGVARMLGETPDQLVEKAAELLDEAKREGGNRILSDLAPADS